MLEFCRILLPAGTIILAPSAPIAARANPAKDLAVARPQSRKQEGRFIIPFNLKALWRGGPLLLALSLATTAHADPSKDLSVVGRSLSFLENGPSGKAVLGVVFDPSKPASVADKNAVMAALGAGLSAGSITLVGKPVEASEVGDVSGVAALYLTKGVNEAAVGSAAKSKRLITIGDLACAASGACVMSVSTDPKVDIEVNRAAAAAVGATFKSAFSMMIHQI